MQVLPDARSWWAEAMHQEVLNIDSDFAALRWAAGCVYASYSERIKAMIAPTQHAERSSGVRLLSPVSFKDKAVDAIRYWEFRRIIYNGALVAVGLGWVVVTWPHFRPALTLQSGLPVLILFVILNACYCSAYVPDIAIQHFPIRPAWQRHRWFLWLLGTLLSMTLWYYWIADEIYPQFHG